MSLRSRTTESDTRPAERTAGRRAAGRSLAALLVCFDGERAAAKARRSLEKRLRSSDSPVLDTTVLRVDGNQKASVHDPGRLLAGVLTPLLTWGVFGFVTGGVSSMIASGLLGAACGGFYAYRGVHHLGKLQLNRLGAALPPRSSALFTFAETSDAGTVLAAASAPAVTASSVAAIHDDLSANVVGAEASATKDRD